MQKDYYDGVRILESPWTELNNRSVTDDMNRGQMMFNAFVDTSVEDPREAWKWRGTRSQARNKGIAMHAQLTGNYLLPSFDAQNENDEIDRDFSEVMRQIAEWLTSPTVSNYQSSFLQIVFGMMQNPVTYLGAEYFEVYQTIKEKTAKGYDPKEILDETLSGFQCPIYSVAEVLITNAYERNIQKQRCIIKRRWVEKSELEAKYGEHPNWFAVREGIRSIYNNEDGLFYDIKDEEHPHLVAEETYLNRRGDAEICFANGVYLGNDDVDNNPIKHRDHRNAPKYDVTPFRYLTIGDHFFYGKSMMNALGWDNMLYDAMTEVVMNRAILEVEMPVAFIGSDKIDSEVIFPNSVVAFESPDVKVQPLMPSSNLAAGFNALRDTEKSIDEGSVSPTLSGQLPEASQKAYSVAQAQANAKKLIGAVGKSLAESVVQYGDLMKDIIIHNITVPQIDELTTGQMRLKYRNFFLPDKGTGKMKSIYFDRELIGREATKEQMEEANLYAAQVGGYPENKNSIWLVNPELFARFRYLTRVDAEEIFAKNAEYWQPILTQLYGMLRADPQVDGGWLLGKLAQAYFQSEGDKLVRREPLTLPQPTGEKGALGRTMEGRQLSTIASGAIPS
ncbi:MAG: hypothetical protein AAB456_00200 [Patescibacteria group bacterium]